MITNFPNFFNTYIKKPWFSFFLICLSCAMIYVQGLNYNFIGIDDGGQILENPYMSEFSWTNIYAIFTTATVDMYQPFTSLMFLVLSSLFGLKSTLPFHLLSLLLHILNTCLVALIGQHLFKHAGKALACSLLFSVHPLHVESVSWISATSTCLFAFFFLSSFLCYTRYKTYSYSAYYWLSISFFLLGCLSKILTISLLGVLFLYDIFIAKKSTFKQITFEKTPYFILAIFSIIAGSYFRLGQSGLPELSYHPFWLIPDQLWWYLKKSLAPFQLIFLYGWPETLSWSSMFLSLCGLLGLGYSCFYFRKNKLFLFGISFYLITIILHTTLFTSFLGPYANRYAYLPLLGLLIAIISILKSPLDSGKVFIGWAFFFCFFCYQSIMLVSTWQSTTDVWSRVLEIEESSFARGMRGAIYYQNFRYEAAIQDFEYFLQKPDFRFESEKFHYIYTALTYMMLNRNPEKAVTYAKQALNYQSDIKTYENVALAYKNNNQPINAETIYQDLLKNHPNTYALYNGLISLYFDQKAYKKLIPLLNTLITANYQPLTNLKRRAYVYFLMGLYTKCSEDITRAEAVTSTRSNLPDAQLIELKKKLTQRGF